ncbi:phosphoribosyltransferase [Thioclava sp. SK-1]|uniref:phosphoribosyltransferase n=1 Tax=Thioclava sp. SK-1 TaxID=1889770 RepID=UPI00082535BB|nr:phosphoribosyltransferase [Thioclava sp. SK-1]OCX63043.1 phosphoribosyltransferase [Thioclava sp. SK-1]
MTDPEPRLDMWQDLRSDLVAGVQPDGETFAAQIGGRSILMPIRALPDGVSGLASLILNQASFEVLDAITDQLSARLRMLSPDVIVAVPTLGLPLAEGVARRLGHRRILPLGVSRKFWYRQELSVPLRSVTSPDAEKRLWLDPRLQGMLRGRVVVVDDVISSGASIRAVLGLLQKVGVQPTAVACAMVQGSGHVDLARDTGVQILSAFATPILHHTGDSWA